MRALCLSIVVFGLVTGSQADAVDYPPKVNGKSLSEWIEEMKSGDRRRQEAALIVLTIAGPAARGAVPAIAAGVESKDIHFACHCLDALAAIGPDAKEAGPAIARFLGAAPSHRDVYEGYKAVIAIGPAAKDAIPALIEAVQDDTFQVRVWAAGALGATGPEAKSAIPALLNAIKDRDTRMYAIYALGRIGPAAKAAVPVIEKHAKDDYEGTTVAVAYAVAAITGKVPEGAAEKFRKAAQAQFTDYFEIGFEGLVLLGGEGVAELVEVVKKPNMGFLPGKAALHLGRLGAGAKGAVPALIELAKRESEPGNQWNALAALGQIGPEAKASVPTLIEQLRGKWPNTQFAAGEALRRIDPEEAKKAGVP